MSPLRVLFVAPNAPPSIGGVEMHLRMVCPRLARSGVDVQVLTVDATGELPAHEALDGLRIERVRGWPRGRDWRLAPGLVRAVGRSGAQLVHVHSYQTFVPPIALAAAQAAGIPTVVTFHSGGNSARFRRGVGPLQTLILSPWLRRARRLVAVSPFEARLFARRLRIRLDRIAVIRNGADLPPVSPGVTTKSGLIVSLGRLEAYKGHRRSIMALAQLQRTDPDARLEILGSGPDEADLRRLAIDLGVADRVDIHAIDSGDRQAYADALGRASAVLVLSEYESQGIAAWEAANLGRPLVVARSTALAELVDLGLAVGVDVNDAAADVAQAVRSVIAGPPAARPATIGPTWDATAAELQCLYEDVLRSK